MLEKAIEISVKAHKGQKDKAGKPYILHCLRVMNAGQTNNEMICGVLHDLVEDTPYTFDDLKREGFTDEVINALMCVTKKEGETYDDFITRILQNPLAVKVKINDLKDNMDITRLNQITTSDIERLQKYKKALQRLQAN
jgi:hypothetical protein|nr:MAG TPA: (p)ppGpp synthetase, RelA/SpoT family [Caudoviricetes sp.]